MSDFHFRVPAAAAAIIDLILTCMELLLLVLLPLKTVIILEAVKRVCSEVFMWGAITFLAFFLLFKLLIVIRLIQATCVCTEPEKSLHMIEDWGQFRIFFFLLEFVPLFILLEWIHWLALSGIIILIWILRDVAFPKILNKFINEDEFMACNRTRESPSICFWSTSWRNLLIVVVLIGIYIACAYAVYRSTQSSRVSIKNASRESGTFRPSKHYNNSAY